MADAETEGERLEIAPNLEVRIVDFADLKEQDVNAHVMPPRTFERLIENIKRRGAMESLAYCWQPRGEGQIEIVSGHHRLRAARAAGLTRGAVLVDTSEFRRTEVVAKQLAHNFLVGVDDEDVLKEQLRSITDPDLLLMSGAPDELLPTPEHEAVQLFAPRMEFDFRTISFAFLPHQQADFEELVKMLDGRQDLVAACPIEQFDDFLKVAGRFARVRKVVSGATAVALMIQLTLAWLEEHEHDAESEQAE